MMKPKLTYLISCGMVVIGILILFSIWPKSSRPQMESSSMSHSEIGGLGAGYSNFKPDIIKLALCDVFSPTRGKKDVESAPEDKSKQPTMQLQLLGIFQYGATSGVVISGVPRRPGEKSASPRVFTVGDVIYNDLILTSVKSNRAILSNSQTIVTLNMLKYAEKNKK